MSTTFATVTSRDLVRVSGPDAVSFLQGQISQDVDALAVGTSTWTFVLQPQGKVDGWARITKTAADVFVLDIDPGFGAGLETRLSRFKIRTKADIESVTERCVSVRGDDAPRGDVAEGVLRLPVAGPAGSTGYDLLGAAAQVPDGVAESAPDVLASHRIVHGIPAMGHELDEDTIPAEVGQWIIDQSVSFTKGCFVGQELVARIDSRGGNVPRRLRALVLDAPVTVGDAVEADAPAGPITTSGIHETFGPVAMAYLGRRIEPDAEVHVGGVRAIVRELPLGDPVDG